MSCAASVAVRVGEVAVGASWDLPAGTVRWSPGPALTLAVATLGLGLNLRAWILLSPLLAGRRDVGLGTYVVLMGLPLLVAALARLPVGVLTDRWGARVMFPVVSLAAAGAVVGLGLSDSLPVVVVVSNRPPGRASERPWCHQGCSPAHC